MRRPGAPSVRTRDRLPLRASPAGGGTDLAAELSVNRRIRGAESFSESQALFTARTKRQVAVEADIARLQVALGAERGM